jgi:phosphoribosylformylglycinamidine cyclo-ligase
LNLTRVKAADVGYVIEKLPPIPPVFNLIQKFGRVLDEEMFRVYNMGIGFCIIVSAEHKDAVLAIVDKYNKKAHEIGYAIQDKERSVQITQKGLIGKDDRFVRADK